MRSSQPETGPVPAPFSTDPLPEPDQPDVVTTSDSQLFGFAQEPYTFGQIDALDEDQRQRRKIRSARREMNLLEADETHLSTMINSVLSTSRDFQTNQTIRASVIRYLTQKVACSLHPLLT